MRVGREATYLIKYGNSGNVDVDEQVLVLSWTAAASLSINKNNTKGEHDQPAPEAISEGTQKAVGLYIPRISAARSLSG